MEESSPKEQPDHDSCQTSLMEANDQHNATCQSSPMEESIPKEQPDQYAAVVKTDEEEENEVSTLFISLNLS